VSAVLVTLAAGFAVAGLRSRSGPPLEDRLLIGLVLALFAALAGGSGAHTLATGVARFGKSGCNHLGTPWSYGIGVISILVGGIALWAAVTTAMQGDSD